MTTLPAGVTRDKAGNITIDLMVMDMASKGPHWLMLDGIDKARERVKARKALAHDDYDPNEPRKPEGEKGGGEWTAGGGPPPKAQLAGMTGDTLGVTFTLSPLESTLRLVSSSATARGWLASRRPLVVDLAAPRSPQAHLAQAGASTPKKGASVQQISQRGSGMGSPGHAITAFSYDGGHPRPNRRPRATCWSTCQRSVKGGERYGARPAQVPQPLVRRPMAR